MFKGIFSLFKYLYVVINFVKHNIFVGDFLFVIAVYIKLS